MNKLDALIERYVEAVIIHGQESWGGNPKKANQNYHTSTKCFIEICRDRDLGLFALRQLLSHSSHFVRYAAAYHILPFDGKAGLKALKKCRNAPDGVGFNSRVTIAEWKKGELEFPVERNGRVIYVSPEEARKRLEEEV